MRSQVSAQMDDGCDTTEQVACIPLPTDSTPASSASGSAAGESAAAVPVPGGLCAQGSCCLQPGIAAPPEAGAAVVPVPIGGCPTTWCGPFPQASAPQPSAAAVPAPAPGALPAYCPPYRSIYTTINLGNAADVRALRTLSPDALRPYWRGNALATLASQIRLLQASGSFATPSLKSIQVQSATMDLLSSTASVNTLEHWLYQQRSSYDGSLVLSQGEWVSNNYTLSSMATGWYITDDQISVLAGP
jgi:hypothetical protein